MSEPKSKKIPIKMKLLSRKRVVKIHKKLFEDRQIIFGQQDVADMWGKLTTQDHLIFALIHLLSHMKDIAQMKASDIEIEQFASIISSTEKVIEFCSMTCGLMFSDEALKKMAEDPEERTRLAINVIENILQYHYEHNTKYGGTFPNVGVCEIEDDDEDDDDCITRL